MSSPVQTPVAESFRELLTECQTLYGEAGREIAEQFPELIQGGSPADFIDMMRELHKALLVKIFSRIAHADHRIYPAQLELARILFEHLWQESLVR